jgi:hypothetical protein
MRPAIGDRIDVVRTGAGEGIRTLDPDLGKVVFPSPMLLSFIVIFFHDGCR